MSYPPRLLQSQWAKIPVPTHSFTGQTIIVTGSNTGMGLEAARHFVRLGASTVVLAVRDLSKGNTAKSSIERSEKSTGVVQVWELDLASYASVQAFAKRTESLERLDVVVGNAGVYLFNFSKAEEDELTITVNVVSTFLLGILLLPKLRETSVKHKKECVLTLTGSFVHYLTNFPERKESNIFEGLQDQETARMSDRYNVSKLIELFCSRELSKRISASEHPGNVTTSFINPGIVKTDIIRDANWYFTLFTRFFNYLVARTSEVGGRTLVHGAEGGSEKHGQYLDDCTVGKVSDFVTSDDGRTTQKKLWGELAAKLERISPGIMSNI